MFHFLFRRKRSPVEALPQLAQVRADLDQGLRMVECCGQKLEYFTTLLEQQATAAVSAGQRQFLIDAPFLFQVFAACCPSQSLGGFKEEFTFAAGYAVPPRTVAIQHLALVAYESQSAVAVTADIGSLHHALNWMDEVGLTLACTFHSHPGAGPGVPSPTDLEFQDRLAAGGHIAIAGIFTADGYLRFYDRTDDFVVRVFGHHVEELRHAPRTFRLALAHADLSQSAAAARIRRGSRPD